MQTKYRRTFLNRGVVLTCARKILTGDAKQKMFAINSIWDRHSMTHFYAYLCDEIFYESTTQLPLLTLLVFTFKENCVFPRVVV